MLMLADFPLRGLAVRKQFAGIYQSSAKQTAEPSAMLIQAKIWIRPAAYFTYFTNL
jgi:hypothetical protein